MEECLAQHDAVHEGQSIPGAERPACTTADLNEAERPAAALTAVFRQTLGREAKRERCIQVDRAKTLLSQTQRQEVVFCYRIRRESANALQRTEPNDGRCPAAECSVPRVHQCHLDIEEVPLFVGPDASQS